MDMLAGIVIALSPFIILLIILSFVIRAGIKKLDSDPGIRNNGIRPAWDRNPISSYFRWRGKISQRGKNFEKAHYWYARSLKAEPNNPLTLTHKGRAYLEAGDYDTARDIFIEILKIDPINYWALTNLAMIALEKDSFEDAIRYSSLAIIEEPHLVDAYILRMQAYFKTNQFEAALSDIEFVRGKKHNLQQLINAFRSTTLLRLGRFEEALQELTIQIEENQKEPDLYNERAWGYAHFGLFDKALSDINKALSLNEKSEAYYDTRAIIYALRENYDKALLDAVNAKEISEDIVHEITYAIILYKANCKVEALNTWKHVLALVEKETQFDLYDFDLSFPEQLQNKYHYPPDLYQTLLELEAYSKS